MVVLGNLDLESPSPAADEIAQLLRLPLRSAI
jgi:hypothetical protein